MSRDDISVTPEAVRSAARQLQGVAHRTPVIRSRTLDTLTDKQLFLKCENFQRVGAFKFRGAFNAVSRIPRHLLGEGVVTYSSGNHAQAVALATRELGTRAIVVMPEDAPRSKVDAVVHYGAHVVTYDRYRGDRVSIGEAIARERHMAVIPPYEHPDVIAGQGTTALELLEDVPTLDTLVLPIGGGGLAAGCGTIAKAIDSGIRVVGVEPEAGDDTRRSLEAGHRVAIPVPRTIADGQAAEIPGALTFAINSRLLEGVALVSDAEVIAAMRFAFDRLKIVIEPSGATALAAVISGRIDNIAARAHRVGIVVSGGNIDTTRFARLLSSDGGAES